MFAKIGVIVVSLVLTLLLVATYNTLQLKSLQIDVEPVKVIEIDADSAARRLAEALRFRTVSLEPGSPPAVDALQGFHDFLGRSFPKTLDTLKREVINEHSLLYTWQGTNPGLKPILFAAHMDVVPVEAGTEEEWTHPPFGGVIADGFIWGRGTMDMKTSLMGILEAVEHLIDQGVTPDRTVYLAFGHDEEVGGPNGAAQISELLQSRGVTIDSRSSDLPRRAS
jgi:carboxypeptidase PM20D1